MLATHRLWLITKSAYLRITLNWVTFSFFLFSFVHCFAQGTLQSFLFSDDDAWGSFTSAIVDYAQINSTAFVQYTGRHGNYSLELCSQVPVLGGGPDPCVHFYTAGQAEPVSIPRRFLPTDSPVSEPSSSSSNTTSLSWTVTGISSSPQVHLESQPNPDGFSDVIISSDDGSTSITLDPVCSFTLLYPQAKLNQTRREELSLIASQFWFYGLAVFAIVFESIPHMYASSESSSSLLTHVGTDSRSSLRACLLLAGLRTLYGAQPISATACFTLSNKQTHPAISICTRSIS
jgi:hypothetical protein